MDAVELVKLIRDGGSFVLLVVIVLWTLFRREPSLKATLENKDAEHAAAVKALSTDCRNTVEAMATAYRTSLDTVAREASVTLATQHKECREERKELLARGDANSDKDRDARHELAGVFQAGLAEMREEHRAALDEFRKSMTEFVRQAIAAREAR